MASQGFGFSSPTKAGTLLAHSMSTHVCVSYLVEHSAGFMSVPSPGFCLFVQEMSVDN